MAEHVKVEGLSSLVSELKGPLFRDVNKELRAASKVIATGMVPLVEAAVRRSQAPQADAFAKTVRVHSDRIPVVVVGKTNPKFRGSRFTRKGSDSKARRGSMALGVVSGGLGGRRDTKAHEDYYHVRRDPGWGALGAAIDGPILRQAETAYLKAFVSVMKAHGFDAST